MLSGIDVSHFQGQIDWKKVAASGVSFAFIKATEGTTFQDPQFQANWAGARDVGIIRGAYHFFRTELPAQQQADFFLSTVGATPLGAGGSSDLAPVLDCELPPQWESFDVEERYRMMDTWLTTVQSALSLDPIIYLSPSFATDVLVNHEGLALWPLWVAHYTTQTVPRIPKPWKTWMFWQKGKKPVPGIKGAVDYNLFNGTVLP